MAEVDYEDIELHKRVRATSAVITQQLAEIERLRAEVERLRGWIDALAPRQSYESTLCPMCHAATEYKFWANVEQHKDGCPWREAARKEARRG